MRYHLVAIVRSRYDAVAIVRSRYDAVAIVRSRYDAVAIVRSRYDAVAIVRSRYDAVAITLHWVIALGILALIIMGLSMTHLGLAPLAKFQLYQLHKSIGITVLLAVLLRILWRLSHRPPPLPAMPPLEKAAAEGTHGLLYVLMLIIPLSGWALVSVSPFNLPTVLYGVVPWPHLPVFPDLANKAAVETVVKFIHGKLAWLLTAVILLHAAAALRHHFLLRDRILARMLPGRTAKEPRS